MKKLLFRLFITFAIFALFAYFVIQNMPVIKETYQTTAANMTGYLLLAVLAIVTDYFFLNYMYLTTYRMVKLSRTFSEMLSLQLQSLAINVVVPTAGVSSAVLFGEEAKKKGDPPPTAISGIFLSFLADYTAIATMLVAVLFILYYIDSLTMTVGISTLIFLLLTLGAYLLTFFAERKTKGLGRFFALTARYTIAPIFRIAKKKVDIEKGVRDFVRELGRAYDAIKSDPTDLVKAIMLAILHHMMRLAALYLIFASFGIYPSMKVLLAGYAIGALFVVVSPTPNGVGFVEGSMTLTFASLGIPAAYATTVTLIYRGLEFWIPFFIGFFLLQRSQFKDLQENIFDERNGKSASA